METQKSADDFVDCRALITQLGMYRHELKVRMHLARCCIRKDWDNAEKKWQRLQATGDHSPEHTRQATQELKQMYILIYRSLLLKSRQLLESVDNIIQETKTNETATLTTLKRQSAMELQAIQLSFEALAGTEPDFLKTLEGESLCSCLKPRPEKYVLFDPGQTKEANKDYRNQGPHAEPAKACKQVKL
jgi:hypothetical protein